MVNINTYIKALLHPSGGPQGSHKAQQCLVAFKIYTYAIAGWFEHDMFDWH